MQNNIYKKLVNLLKNSFPGFFRVLFFLKDMVNSVPTRLQLFLIRKSESGLAIAYLGTNFPKPPARRNRFAHGGAVKLTYLAETFPHHFPTANLLYVVSSVGHPLQTEILSKAKRQGLKIIVNQNGVAFPAWDGVDYEITNRSLTTLINFADFIFYQSQFCRESAKKYISPPDVPNEIVYNPVDIAHFTPLLDANKPKEFTLLLGGNQHQIYRLDLALQTLQKLLYMIPNARLIVTGKFWLPKLDIYEWMSRSNVASNIKEHVTFAGSYSQSEAPFLYSNAHVLLHTQYADASPGIVTEALACGLPAIYVKNGGVPELVGDAGVGVHIQHDWDRINLPSPKRMAEAVMQVYYRYDEYSQRARQRAVELFSLEKFVAKHREIFEKLLNSS